MNAHFVRRSGRYEGTQASQPATRPEDAQYIIAGKMPAYPAKPMVNENCSMVKNAIKRGQSQACLSYAEREHFRRSQWSKMRLSEGRAKLA